MVVKCRNISDDSIKAEKKKCYITSNQEDEASKVVKRAAAQAKAGIMDDK